MISTSSASYAVEYPGRAHMAASGLAHLILSLLVALFASVGGAWAQATTTVSSSPAADAPQDLEGLISHALSVHPSIRAARDRIEAAQAAIRPAGALPDPMLGVGVMNVPVTGRDQDDMTSMTMATVGVGQTIPYPGKLGLRRRVAELELAAAEARLEAARWAIRQEVTDAYADLAFLDRALEIVRRNEKLLGNFIQATQSRYGVGTGSQADVLKARVEAARLAEEAVALTERRRAALARLNAALDRPSETAVAAPTIPMRIARAAVAENAGEIRFASAALGSRAAGSPLPALAELQETAVRQNPAIRAHQAMIEAQAARVELARKEHLPDFDVSLQYGQRNDASDVVSAMVSIPIPLRKGQRQDLLVKEAQAELSALQAEHHEQANEIRAAVASAYADLERDRAQLALYVKSIIPQGRAALESATASFQVGRVDFLTLLENQTTLYNYETAYYDALTRFTERLAGLERTVGEEILR
jgi:cobalt-zinc-cadmium efflux system outer membrane protein